MKILYKKIKAFTLAEVAIVVMILALIASVTIKITKSRSNHYLNSFMSYSAFTSLQSGMEELVATGCSDNDYQIMIPSPPHPYCATKYSLPLNGHTTDSRGLCDRLLDEEVNTVGTFDCFRTISSETGQFDTAHTNFTTTNGMSFLNFGSIASGTPLLYTVYVDIDGPRRNSVLNEDVVKFNIYTNGVVLPAPDSIAATDVEYLSASVRYWDSAANKYQSPKVSVSYREAACTANKAQSTDGNYCGTLGDPTYVPADAICSDGIHDCEVILNKPEFMFGR